MAQKYASTLYNKERMAKVIGKQLPVSTKHCIEICKLIRGKNTLRAKKLLEGAISLKKAIPFTRFNGDVGHRKSIPGPGRYPVKAAEAVLDLVKSAESNAQFKGLNTSNLIIIHSCAHLASRQMRYGRQRGRKTKRTHVEIIVDERAVKGPEAKKERKAQATAQEKTAAPKAADSGQKAETMQKETPAKADEAKAEDKKPQAKQPKKDTDGNKK